MSFPDEKVSTSKVPCILFILIVIGLLLPSISFAASSALWLPKMTEDEPNNLSSQANVINIPLRIQARLSMGDIDRYNISLDHEVTIEIRVDSSGNEGDVKLELLVGNTIIEGNRGAITQTLPAGSYMISVSSTAAAEYDYLLIIYAVWDIYWVVYAIIITAIVVGVILALRKIIINYKQKIVKTRGAYLALQRGFYSKLVEFLKLRRDLGRIPTVEEAESKNIAVSLLVEGINRGWLHVARPRDPGGVDSMLGKMLAKGIKPSFESLVLDGDVPIPLALQYVWLLSNPSAKISFTKYDELHSAMYHVLRAGKKINVLELSAKTGIGPHAIKIAAETLNEEIEKVSTDPGILQQVDEWTRVIMRSGKSVQEAILGGKIPIEVAIKVIASMKHWEDILDYIPQLENEKVETAKKLLGEGKSFMEIIKEMDIGCLSAVRLLSEAARQLGINMPSPPKLEMEHFEIVFPEVGRDLIKIRKEILELVK
ncbi:MAG: hypothetical protein QXL15_02185 [Candidatus Korarchaeota archaeon]